MVNLLCNPPLSTVNEPIQVGGEKKERKEKQNYRKSCYFLRWSEVFLQRGLVRRGAGQGRGEIPDGTVRPSPGTPPAGRAARRAGNPAVPRRLRFAGSSPVPAAALSPNGGPRPPRPHFIPSSGGGDTAGLPGSRGPHSPTPFHTSRSHGWSSANELESALRAVWKQVKFFKCFFLYPLGNVKIHLNGRGAEGSEVFL